MPKSCEECRCTFDGFDGSTKCILGAKRIDQAKRPKDCPLVEFTRPQGKWIKEPNGKTTDLYRCSICNRSIMLCKNADLTKYPFCHCGADMKGEE